jgi:hypothetical protein
LEKSKKVVYLERVFLNDLLGDLVLHLGLENWLGALPEKKKKKNRERTELSVGHLQFLKFSSVTEIKIICVVPEMFEFARMQNNN